MISTAAEWGRLRGGLWRDHFAAEAGAALLLRDIEALATSCRISLDEPSQPAEPETEAAPFNTLTKREHKVLSHLAAGRAYTEIAEAPG